MRTFSAQETGWQRELDGIELAGFWRRAFAFVLDWLLILVLLTIVALFAGVAYNVVAHLRGQPAPLHFSSKSIDGPNMVKRGGHWSLTVGPGDKKPENEPEWLHWLLNVFVPVLYFGTALWWGKGRTLGKRLMKVRVVSIVHPHLTFWHSVERAFGYGAAALEGGLGFVQFFIHPYRRCAQDRLAETIVVTERGYQDMKHKFEGHPITATPLDSSPA